MNLSDQVSNSHMFDWSVKNVNFIYVANHGM